MLVMLRACCGLASIFIAMKSEAQVFQCMRAKAEAKCNFLAVGVGYEAQGQKFEDTNASGELGGLAPRFSIYLKKSLKSSQLVLQYSSATSNLASPENYRFVGEPGPFTSILLGWGKNTKALNFMLLLGQQKYPLVSSVDTARNLVTIVPSSQNLIGLSFAKGLFQLWKWESGGQLDVSYLMGESDKLIKPGIHYSLGLRSVYPLKRGTLFSLASLSFINQQAAEAKNTAAQTSFSSAIASRTGPFCF